MFSNLKKGYSGEPTISITVKRESIILQTPRQGTLLAVCVQYEVKHSIITHQYTSYLCNVRFRSMLYRNFDNYTIMCVCMSLKTDLIQSEVNIKN